VSARVCFGLMLVTDLQGLVPGCTLPDVVEGALLGGVDAVQLREKDLDQAELLALACELRALTRAHGAALIVNSHVEVALAAQADGVHLPSAMADVGAARAALGEASLVGVSTHSIADVENAARAGADYVTFGPVHATPSKAGYGPPLGLDALRQACAVASAMPVFAIGGVRPQDAEDVIAAGARVAAISGLVHARDPREAAGRYAGQRVAARHAECGDTCR